MAEVKKVRLIDATALYKEVTEKYKDINAGCYPYNIVTYDMAELVKNAPTIDAVPVVHGRNIGDDDRDEWYRPIAQCSICKCCWMMQDEKDLYYCPHCGALMEEGAEDGK